jgi:hypothetical protein
METKITAGGYYATHAYAGDGTDLGYMVGIKIPILEEKLNFLAEYISDTNQISNCIAAFNFQ